MREASGCLLVILIAVAVFAAAIGGTMLLVRGQCANHAEVLEVEYRWRALGGCYLQVDGRRFVPVDNYRITEDS